MQSSKLTIAQYLKSNIGALMFRCINVKAFSNSVIIDAMNNVDLVGHYDGMEYLPPQWYVNLIDSGSNYLIISNLDKIDMESQKKFIEILKYKKVDIYSLPKYCKVIVNVDYPYLLDEEVYSLLIDIK